jgi:hypothetical protein
MELHDNGGHFLCTLPLETFVTMRKCGGKLLDPEFELVAFFFLFLILFIASAKSK